jgi:hypothetical protein
VTSDAPLVPPHRLGVLLQQRRTELGRSIEDVAATPGSTFSVPQLRQIEAGGAQLSDSRVNQLLEVYRAEGQPVVPARFGLEIDLTEGRLSAGRNRVSLPATVDAGSLDETLGRYLTLLYLLRGAEPGTRIDLRDRDLGVLSTSLEEAVTDIERRLVALMVDRGVDPWFTRLRHKLAVPAAGIFVGLTAVGGLVLVQFPSGERPQLTMSAAADSELIPAVALDRSQGPEYEPGNPLSIGAAAERLIGYPFRSVLTGWAISYAGPRSGYRGNTNTITRTITLYIDANDTPSAVSQVLAHEVGHALDVMYLEEQDRKMWMDARGLPNPWWPESGAADFAVGAGDFAEAVSAVLTGSKSDAVAGEYTVDQLTMVRELMP